ncbi:hypothetical protein [Roseiconus lacunae]|uniref:Uncharacterized protein n=1 Tax=Roseiconus lacunae TaxID=2605694 RepID=A0ABT7PH83_9BACT|nr:hypothetical protein [Roseiconus lacunae]MDM4015847.1 hypothetical protein [Roseiconus lacunae]
MDPATGIIAVIAEQLGTAIQATAGWSDLVDATIHYNDLPPPASGVDHTKLELVNLRPFALIWTIDEGGFTATRNTTGGMCVDRTGQLLIRIERNVPADTSDADAERQWENIISRIMDNGDPANPGLIQLGGDPRYLPITSITRLESTRSAPEKRTEIGDAQRAFLHVIWASE